MYCFISRIKYIIAQLRYNTELCCIQKTWFKEPYYKAVEVYSYIFSLWYEPLIWALLWWKQTKTSVRNHLTILKQNLASFLACLFESTHRAIAVTTMSVSALASALLKMLTFLVKIFKNLNLWMDLVDILSDVRYWSEVLFWPTSVTLRSRSQTLKLYIFWNFRWILLILSLILDTGLNCYASPSPPPHYPWGQGHWLGNFMLKFLEVNISWIFRDLVDPLPDVRYWSKILRCTIPMAPTRSLTLKSRS